MPRRHTLPEDANPLSAILPEESDRLARRDQRMTAPLREARRREEPQRKPVSTKKERVAFYLSEELADAIRNAVVQLSGPPLRLTMTELAEMAFQKELERLKAEHNDGKPFPKRAEDLKGGRPIR
jgi:hypothetical protein